MGKFVTDIDPRKRTKKFLRAYSRAPNDADIAVRIGHEESEGAPAVFISIGNDMHAFSVWEARVVAAAAEKTLPMSNGNDGLENLILALRLGADTAEKAGPSPSTKEKE